MKCQKCGRPSNPWPLGHKSCSPKGWAFCISTSINKEIQIPKNVWVAMAMGCRDNEGVAEVLRVFAHDPSTMEIKDLRQECLDDVQGADPKGDIIQQFEEFFGELKIVKMPLIK